MYQHISCYFHGNIYTVVIILMAIGEVQRLETLHHVHEVLLVLFCTAVTVTQWMAAVAESHFTHHSQWYKCEWDWVYCTLTMSTKKIPHVFSIFRSNSVAEQLWWWVNLGVMPPLSDWEFVDSNPMASMSRIGFFIQGRNFNSFL